LWFYGQVTHKIWAWVVIKGMRKQLHMNLGQLDNDGGGIFLLLGQLKTNLLKSILILDLP